MCSAGHISCKLNVSILSKSAIPYIILFLLYRAVRCRPISIITSRWTFIHIRNGIGHNGCLPRSARTHKKGREREIERKRENDLIIVSYRIQIGCHLEYESEIKYELYCHWHSYGLVLLYHNHDDRHHQCVLSDAQARTSLPLSSMNYQKDLHVTSLVLCYSEWQRERRTQLCFIS